MFIGSTSEIDTAQKFAVRTDSVIHPIWEEKKKCTQTKRKSFWRNRCFRILICDLSHHNKKNFYKYFTQHSQKKRYKSCHCGGTFTKGTPLYLKSAYKSLKGTYWYQSCTYQYLNGTYQNPFEGYCPSDSFCTFFSESVCIVCASMKTLYLQGNWQDFIFPP